MKKIFTKSVVAALSLSLLLLGAISCKKEGPMERAGKSVDNTVEKGKQNVEQVGRDIKKDVKGK